MILPMILPMSGFSVALLSRFLFFFFNDPATTEIYTLSLHDALPISTTEGFPPGPLHLQDESLPGHEVAHTLVRCALEVLDDERPVHVLLVGLDDGVPLEGELSLERREGDDEAV